MISIVSHRGLEPSRPISFVESSYEAFEDHLKRGYGIEFDPYFTSNGIFVSHQDMHVWKNIPTLTLVLKLVSNYPNVLSALHLKGKFQDATTLDRLIEIILDFPTVLNHMLLFDVTSNMARYLRKRIPEVLLAPSVSHGYDIKRFNLAVYGTLISLEEAIKNRPFYDWVWLDEWDRLNHKGGGKTLYNIETFKKLRDVGYKIALVTPELHRTSPGLLGGETHADAASNNKLFERIKEILELEPDAVCTDYPEEVRSFLG